MYVLINDILNNLSTDISENNKKLFGKFEDKSAFCILNLYAQMPENTIYTLILIEY